MPYDLQNCTKFPPAFCKIVQRIDAEPSDYMLEKRREQLADVGMNGLPILKR